MLDDLLRMMPEVNASDLHLSAGRSPKFRSNGDIVACEKYTSPLSSEDITKMIENILLDKEKYAHFQKHHEVDFSYEIEGLARFRVNCFQQQRGIGAVMRIIPNNIKSLDELNLGDSLKTFKKLCALPRGIILVTGPTGSGKSTTLASMIDHINQHRKEHILTIEDPIEFVHQEKSCLINQREVHKHTDSFSNALRASLREDPDIILVGEMRDLETIRLALTAAETGHLVFGTLHTTSAAKTIDRIVDVFPAEEKEMVRAMLSESLQAVISQALLKNLSGGRVAAHEIMICSSAIRNLIRENKTAQMYSTIQTGLQEGMTTLDQSLKKLVKEKKISLQTAKEYAKVPDQIS